MGVLNKKLQAYTLIETIISLIIIMLVFSIAMMIFINVVKADNIIIRTEVFFKMNEIIQTTKSKQEYIDDLYKFKGYHIKRTVFDHPDIKNLKILRVESFDNNGKLMSKKSELILDY